MKNNKARVGKMNKGKKLLLCLIIIAVACGMKVKMSDSHREMKTKEVPVPSNPTIFVMGDSKSSFYGRKKYPRQGWVQQFIPMLKSKERVKPYHPEGTQEFKKVVRYDFDDYSIENWSKGGISCKKFYKKGRFRGMLSRVKKNDYVIIALQHNDKKPKIGESIADYKEYLIYFTQQIQKKGAKVIFMTTPPKNYRDEDEFEIYVPRYRKAMIEVAKDYKCDCIDLSKLTTDYFNFRGKQYADTLYMKLKPDQYAAWEDGIEDDTHFQRNGAMVLARIIAVNLQANHQIPLLNQQFRYDTNGLYEAYQQAAAYKNKKQYTKKSWKNMITQRNNAWTVLYTPNATDQQCKQAEQSLRRSLKGLKRKHG